MSITLHGPLFNDDPRHIMDRAVDEMKREVAQRGVNMVHNRLHSVLQHPTGAYEHSVVSDFTSEDPRVVGDRKIYGAWLEGTGSRNRTTRFKGYRTFRMIAQELQNEVPKIVDPIMRKHLGDLQ